MVETPLHVFYVFSIVKTLSNADDLFSLSEKIHNRAETLSEKLIALVTKIDAGAPLRIGNKKNLIKIDKALFILIRM